VRPTLAQLFYPWVIVPKGHLGLTLRPGQKLLMRPGAVQFWNAGPFDWWLIEAALAGWLVDG